MTLWGKARHQRRVPPVVDTTNIIKIGAPHELKPANVPIERFVAWTAIVKIDDLQSVADIKDITVREFTKLEVIIQVPFRAGNQFLGEGGRGIHDKMRVIADRFFSMRILAGSSIAPLFSGPGYDVLKVQRDHRLDAHRNLEGASPLHA
ncbi:hypothetical protein ARMGADRAFT_1082377 [Armillaria gallica]|uniref:Uncharacterized protein n=1 Tax=Armillaria gallica TaxID=47427 RepID=A0A2H3DGR2_ARMGA|nr:hypothetical protein ARMGADRAFT_1082377 [Armillaria gallica]